MYVLPSHGDQPLHFQKVMDHTCIGKGCRESMQARAKFVDVALVESHGLFDGSIRGSCIGPLYAKLDLHGFIFILILFTVDINGCGILRCFFRLLFF